MGSYIVSISAGISLEGPAVYVHEWARFPFLIMYVRSPSDPERTDMSGL